jgi:hypothetical protein
MQVTLYGYNPNRLSNGKTVSVNFRAALPENFTPVPPPLEIPSNKYAFYNKSNSTWTLIDYVPEDVLPTPKPPVYRPLTRLEFETHAQTAAGLTDLEFLAALQDPNLALLWHRVSIAERVERDNDLTQNGLAAMVAAGHLTEEQVEAINDSWPTE